MSNAVWFPREQELNDLVEVAGTLIDCFISDRQRIFGVIGTGLGAYNGRHVRTTHLQVRNSLKVALGVAVRGRLTHVVASRTMHHFCPATLPDPAFSGPPGLLLSPFFVKDVWMLDGKQALL